MRSAPARRVVAAVISVMVIAIAMRSSSSEKPRELSLARSEVISSSLDIDLIITRDLSGPLSSNRKRAEYIGITDWSQRDLYSFQSTCSGVRVAGRHKVIVHDSSGDLITATCIRDRLDNAAWTCCSQSTIRISVCDGSSLHGERNRTQPF